MTFHLIKFKHKSECRLLLRKLNIHIVKHSSIFKLIKPNLNQTSDIVVTSSSYLYMLIEIRDDSNSADLTSHVLLISDIAIIDVKTRAGSNILTALFNWAYYEITQSLEFVKLENQTTLVNNNYGRQLIVNDNGISFLLIRTFEYLPEIFGIINYTSDSFSDGGLYNNIDLVCKQVEEYIAHEVSVIDIGVESTRPNATTLNADLEIAKLKEILPAVMAMKKYYNNQFKISIDTYHAETVAYLNNLDIDIINDVSGSIAGNVIKNIVTNGKKYVAMHSLTIPADKNKIMDINSDIVEVIYLWMCKKLEKLIADYQIDSKCIILDPGIGFGNNSAQAWRIINQLDKFRSLPCDLLLGHSRKSFLAHIVNNSAANRDLETALVAAYAMPKVDYLRLHDVSTLNTIYSIQSNLR